MEIGPPRPGPVVRGTNRVYLEAVPIVQITQWNSNIALFALFVRGPAQSTNNASDAIGNLLHYLYSFRGLLPQERVEPIGFFLEAGQIVQIM